MSCYVCCTIYWLGAHNVLHIWVVGDIFVQKYLCVCSKIIIWTYVTNTLHNIIYSLSPWHEFASCLGFEAFSAAATYLLEFAHF